MTSRYVPVIIKCGLTLSHACPILYAHDTGRTADFSLSNASMDPSKDQVGPHHTEYLVPRTSLPWCQHNCTDTNNMSIHQVFRPQILSSQGSTFSTLRENFED